MVEHFHLHLPELTGILHELRQINNTLKKGFTRMSEASDALTAAVTQVATEINNLSTSQQTEIQQIIDALNGAGDADLRDAVNQSIPRLQTMATQLQQMNTVMQGIIP